MNNNILVTGGAGFIGSHLCHKLVDSGENVICVDNLHTGSFDNIKDLCNYNNFKFIEHDIVEPLEIECSKIYNLACPASPVHYQTNPIKTMKTSVLGIINMLELAKKNNARILQTSTSEVYGNPLIHPQDESYFGNVNPISIRACYDEGKRAAETLMYDYKRMYDLDIRIVRIFNTYGPKMAEDDGRVVSNFICQALTNKDITVYGDGSQTRSFCYVKDTVDAIYKMMEQEEILGPVNIGNPHEITVKKFAEIIIDFIDTNSKIIYKELPSDDPCKRKPNIDLAKKYLNWSPEVPLEIGLQNTIDYFKDKLSCKQAK